MPIWRAVRMIRQAISPRLAMRSDWIMAKHPESSASLFPGGSPREARPKGRGESPASHSEHAEVRALRYGRVQRRRKRSEEHTSELQSLMRISYAVFCLKKQKHRTSHITP